MSLVHREQPKIGEEGVWPSTVIAEASTLARVVREHEIRWMREHGN
ncbi:hypothetical protein [Cupriavidus pauculus]|nr:hypothetical protein [Cupriavidus pauculus]